MGWQEAEGGEWAQMKITVTENGGKEWKWNAKIGKEWKRKQGNTKTEKTWKKREKKQETTDIREETRKRDIEEKYTKRSQNTKKERKHEQGEKQEENNWSRQVKKTTNVEKEKKRERERNNKLWPEGHQIYHSLSQVWLRNLCSVITSYHKLSKVKISHDKLRDLVVRWPRTSLFTIFTCFDLLWTIETFSVFVSFYLFPCFYPFDMVVSTFSSFLLFFFCSSCSLFPNIVYLCNVMQKKTSGETSQQGHQTYQTLSKVLSSCKKLTGLVMKFSRTTLCLTSCVF